MNFLHAFHTGTIGTYLQEALVAVFGGDLPEGPLRPHQVAARAAGVFLVGLAIVRLGKSRVVGRVTSLDVLLGFILGSLLSRGITGHASITDTTVAAATMVALHWLLTAVACRWHGFGNLVKGHCSLVVKDGQTIPKNMLASHISEHDLVEELHMHGLDSLEDVHLAYKERNGEISVIPRKLPSHLRREN